jgi:hypothetical protein
LKAAKALAQTTVVLLAAVAVISCSRDDFYDSYAGVETGMSLERVEEILGKGVQLSEREVPTTPDFSKPLHDRIVPVVKGEVVYKWERGDKYILIGFQERKVVGRWFWEPSL